jgi:predicted helicase
VSLRSAFVEVATGFETARDHFAIAFTEKELRSRLDALAGPLTNTEIRQEFGLDDKRDWELPSARARIKQLKNRYAAIRQISYRPFDCRFTHYDDIIVTWPRKKNLAHISPGCPALIASRMIKGEVPNHFFVVEEPPEKIFISAKTSNNAFVFPLFRSDGTQETIGNERRQPNFSPEFLNLLTKQLGQKLAASVIPNRNHHTLTAEAVFGYIYAVVHSQTYRESYAEELKIDFPCVPITSDKQLFWELSDLGLQLSEIHLAASQGNTRRYRDALGHNDVLRSKQNPTWYGTEFVIAPAHPKWSADSLAINESSGVACVSEPVWESRVGGYQVAAKWLKDRRGTRLTKEERDRYVLILLALESTSTCVGLIETCITRHGGWPLVGSI